MNNALQAQRGKEMVVVHSGIPHLYARELWHQSEEH